MERILAGKRITLGVCGGIAAYKSVELLRLLVKEEALIRVVMTRNAARFVGPVTFSALSGEPVLMDLFEEQDASIKHIDWAVESDAVVIAPATANIIGKAAAGIADDALSTFLLAVTCPVLFCPSMNVNMYKSTPVTENLRKLKERGYTVMKPDPGELACGVTGPGRLPEPAYIADRLAALLCKKDLAGKRILVTAGPTRENIDPVRFITNYSSGKMGYAMARAAEYRGAAVTLVSGPTSLSAPANVRFIPVDSAREMAGAVLENMAGQDVIIKSAAVSDYAPVKKSEQKIKKRDAKLVLELEKTIDILFEASKRREPGQIMVGFAAETEELEKNAGKKLAAKDLDMIVGNLVGCEDSGFGTDTNRVIIRYKDGRDERLELMSKWRLAFMILDRVASLLPGPK